MSESVESQVSADSTPFQAGASAFGPSRERLDGSAADLTIYVASSWRNEYQPAVVDRLRAAGFGVYDFRHPAVNNDGFAWSHVYGRPGDAATWADGVPAPEMLAGLAHPLADQGFALDFEAMETCDACVLVLPCGRSAHLELGWFVGRGKPTAILLDDPCLPELMYKMVDHIAVDLPGLVDWLDVLIPSQGQAGKSE